MTLDKNMKKAGAFSYIALFIIWGLLEVSIVPFMEKYFDVYYIEFIKEVFLKTLIWLIPATLLCKQYHQILSIQNKSSFSINVNWLKVVLVLCLFTAYHVISTYVQNGIVSIDDAFKITDVLIAISVGISEEMVFRGWLLNVSLQDKNWVTIFINGLLFLFIHFPVWIRHDMLGAYMMSGSFLQIIVLSVIFSYAFIKSKNIMVPILLHAYWDFLCFIL